MYEIKVMGYREALDMAYNSFGISSIKNYAIISIQEYNFENMGIMFKAGGKCKSALNIHFSDINPKDYSKKDFEEYRGELKAISKTDLNRIISFVDKVNHIKDVDDLIIQCHAGVSRSSAVAAAITLINGGNDISYFESNIYYPNEYVYRKLLERGLKGKSEEDIDSIVKEKVTILKEIYAKKKQSMKM